MPQANLKFNCDINLAGRIGCYNRHYAEHFGFAFEPKMTFTEELFNHSKTTSAPFTFYDSTTGKPVFLAPVGRTMNEFINESEDHGWPSFRDNEVVWENVRVL